MQNDGTEILHSAFCIHPSDSLVAPELEPPPPRQPFDPVRQVTPQVFRPEMARTDAPVGIDHPLPHPRVGRTRVRAGERLQERQPLEVAPLLLARRALAAPRIDRLRDLELFAD